MEERVSIRRSSTGSMVNVTVKDGDNSTHWQVRVLGPTPALIAAAVKECRSRCEMLHKGIAEAAA